MPYAKMSRRQYRSKRNYRNRSLASKAYSLAKKAYKAPELKYIKTTGSVTSPSTSGGVQELSVCSQGSTNNDRIGDSISPTSVAIRLKASLNATASETQIRILLYRWKLGTSTGVTDVLESSSPVSFKSEDKRFQSEILYDRVFQLDAVRSQEMFVSFKRQLKHRISYAESATAANTNGIYIAILSDESTNTPGLSYRARLFYRDC